MPASNDRCGRTSTLEMWCPTSQTFIRSLTSSVLTKTRSQTLWRNVVDFSSIERLSLLWRINGMMIVLTYWDATGTKVFQGFLPSTRVLWSFGARSGSSSLVVPFNHHLFCTNLTMWYVHQVWVSCRFGTETFDVREGCKNLGRSQFQKQTSQYKLQFCIRMSSTKWVSFHWHSWL